MDPQAIIGAVKSDMESRTYYWGGEDDGWMLRSEFYKIGDPRLVTGAFKGTVPSFEHLPKRGNVFSDYYVVEPSSPVMAFAGMGASGDMAPITLTCRADQIKAGEPTLRGVVMGAEREPNTKRTHRSFTEYVHRFVCIALTDERLALMVDDNRDPVLMSRAKADECGLSVVKAIEVNRLHVTAVSNFDGFGVVLSYNGRPVHVDRSAY